MLMMDSIVVIFHNPLQFYIKGAVILIDPLSQKTGAWPWKKIIVEVIPYELCRNPFD